MEDVVYLIMINKIADILMALTMITAQWLHYVHASSTYTNKIGMIMMIKAKCINKKNLHSTCSFYFSSPAPDVSLSSSRSSLVVIPSDSMSKFSGPMSHSFPACPSGFT